MSVEKVERYKKLKKNRKKIQSREKLKKNLGILAVVLSCGLICGVIGFNVYTSYIKPKLIEDVDMNALMTAAYNVQSANTETTEATAESEDKASTESTDNAESQDGTTTADSAQNTGDAENAATTSEPTATEATTESSDNETQE